MNFEQDKPIIGVSSIEIGNFDGWFETFHMHTCRADASHVIDKVGGTPIIIPAMPNEKHINQYFDIIDGLFVTGGYDILPYIYGEDMHIDGGNSHPMTDRFDIHLVKEAFRRKIPIICVCRGLQIANIVFGGTLYQDLYTEKENVYVKHNAPKQGNLYVHKVNVLDHNSMFSKLVGKTETVYVNSIHHQAIKDIAPMFKVVGKSADDVVEIVELKNADHFFIGMQFHPEIMVNHGDDKLEPIFKGFVEACYEEKKNKIEMLTEEIRKE
ncbi:gamma-glutamyl-gamma-aminobutyrate hydrolase family protein [Mycoplasma sp. P36-A1]|uniref:gamma-glutamyl-gamma-aminobutyrate hydrolase family protein n=1 Tax=Mycoplasma sp. P36-A1 TaxID=3252900 RepID=UPI003C2E1E58